MLGAGLRAGDAHLQTANLECRLDEQATNFLVCLCLLQVHQSGLMDGNGCGLQPAGWRRDG